MSELNKTLTLVSGTALFLNIVIGAGLLVIPGLAYQQVGETAFFSWIVCALASLSILLVFIILGRNHPDSGGISHYAYKAFGSFMQRASAYLLLGAVALGLPSIAMTGGYYLDSVLSLNFYGSVHIYAIAFVLLSATLHITARDSVAKVLGVIGSSIIIVLLLLLIISIMGLNMELNIDNSAASTSLVMVVDNANIDYDSIFTPFMMIFFAFTGWGIAAHSAEEFINIRKDFPLAMILSFVIATLFYLAIAWVVQQARLQTNFNSPFLALTEPVLGSHGAYLVAVVAVIIIFANIFGAIWGISRLVYSLGKSKILPATVAITDNGIPKRAIVAVISSMLVTLTLDYLQLLDINSMMALAGQNFLILYGIAAASLFVLGKSKLIKLLAIAVLLLVLLLLYFAGSNMAYPSSLVALAGLMQLLVIANKPVS